MPKELGLTDLPSDVGSAVSKFTDEQRVFFWERYNRETRSVGAMVALAILFPIHFFFLDRTGLGVAYWLTAGFVFVGWFVIIFLTPGWVREYNAQRGRAIASDIRLMGA